MNWYHSLACFFAGMFLANFVPHFVKGISGDKFPTPFAKPPGKGLSPAYINVLWAAFNVVIGYLLLGASHLQTSGCCTGLIVFFTGAVLMALLLSVNFTK